MLLLHRCETVLGALAHEATCTKRRLQTVDALALDPLRAERSNHGRNAIRIRNFENLTRWSNDKYESDMNDSDDGAH